MRSLLLVLALVGAFSGRPAMAHEGHDHGAPPPPVTATLAPRMEASSTVFEAVAVARGGDIDIYVDQFVDNAPVAGAVVEVDTRDGVVPAVEIEPGLYRIPAPWAAGPGAHDLTITVIADAGLDVLVGTLTIPEPPVTPVAEVNPAAALATDLAAMFRAQLARPDATVLLAATGAFIVGVLFMLAWRRARWAAIALAGVAVATAVLWWPIGARAESATTGAKVVVRDLAQRAPDGALFVPKSTQRVLGIRTMMTDVAEHGRKVELPGRIIPDPGASGLVQASLEGRLVPPSGGFPQLGDRIEAGQVLAIVEPTIGAVDIVDRQQQIREIEQQVRLVSRRLNQRRQLDGVVTRTEIEELEIELAGLNEQLAALQSLSDLSEELVAPVAGVIAAGQAVPGQIVAPGSTVYQIVHPDRMWVEALSYRAEPIGENAVAVIGEGTTVALLHEGTGLADQGQAVPVRFSIVGPAEGLRVGQLVPVIASAGAKQQGIAVPRDAVLRSANGQMVVYVKSNAERFVQREVRVEPLDGETVLVVAGLEDGLRIVTSGAELLNQIR